MADQVTLFGTWASPFSRRVEMALKLKGVEYEYIEEDLHNKSALLLEYNPIHKKIPVLVHNGKVIVESLIILEYIDETWNHNSFMPQHPYDRAMARFWAKFIDETLMPSGWRAKIMKQDGEAAVKEMCELVKMLESQLNGKKLFGGDSIGYLDIVGNRVAFWLPVTVQVVGYELVTAERFPKLSQWIEKLETVEVAVQCRPPKDKFVQYMQQLMYVGFLATSASASQ